MSIWTDWGCMQKLGRSGGTEFLLFNKNSEWKKKKKGRFLQKTWGLAKRSDFQSCHHVSAGILFHRGYFWQFFHYNTQASLFKRSR